MTNKNSQVVRPSSLHYRDRQERGEPIPLHTLTAPHLPRAASLRPLNCEFDWTGAPKSIFHRQVIRRQPIILQNDYFTYAYLAILWFIIHEVDVYYLTTIALLII